MANPREFNQRLWRNRLTPAPRQLTNQKPTKKLGKIRNKCVRKDKNKERLALLYTKMLPIFPNLTPLQLKTPESTLSRVRKPKQRSNKKALIKRMSLRLYTITTTKKVIMPSTTLCQKICDSLSHLDIYNG